MKKPVAARTIFAHSHRRHELHHQRSARGQQLRRRQKPLEEVALPRCAGPAENAGEVDRKGENPAG